MAIETLRIEQFRNLAQQSLQFSPGLNFISGENGSGKSSLLEALFFFSRLKSFRTHKTSELVQNGCDYFRLLGKTFPRLNAATTERIENTAVIGGHSEHHIGMEKSARGAALKIRLDRQTQKSAAPLLQLLPTLAITAQSFTLIDAGPAYRRQFIDYGVFHFDAQFYRLALRYQKTLKQCNATLRQKLPPAVLQSYHPQLAEYGESIHQKRLAYFQALKPILDNLLAQLQFPEPVTLKYQAGWNLDQSFLQQLEHGIAHDYRLAHTRYGPHRADISFSTPKGRALQYLSRGQQKVLILALYLSQMQLIQAQHGHYPILLIDDIAAELDAARYQSTLQYLAQLPCQIFLSTTEFRPMTLDHNRAYPLQHFYVENGNLRMQQPL